MQPRQEVQNADADTRTIQEPINFLTALQQKSAEQGPTDGVYMLGDKEVPQLDCLAFVRQGQIIPLFDLAGLPIPTSPEGKVYFSVVTVQHIMSGILDALELMQEKSH